MFQTTAFFRRTPCPEVDTCSRVECIFSHDPKNKLVVTTVPVAKVATLAQKRSTPPSMSASAVRLPTNEVVTLPVKRPAPHGSSSSTSQSLREPPTKQARLGSAQRPLAKATATALPGPPVLSVNAAQSQVALPVRQTMLKNLYDHFVVLYQNDEIQRTRPNLAAEHALKQEQEVYAKSTKFTYRNAVVNSIATLKKRERPDSVNHPSVGTNEELLEREAKKQELEGLVLKKDELEMHVLSHEQLQQWGFMTELPPGPGGDKSSEEGNSLRCERCGQQFQVLPKEGARECNFHWGKKLTTRANDGNIRIYSCCSRETREADGCTSGPHVFYESDPTALHSRHPFSYSKPSSENRKLDVCCLDCEMIYTTAGMSIARVSVVDGSGKEVLDELVRLDDGVQVIDYNTRFSGILAEEYAKATLTLDATRSALDELIDTNTIIIGHALDNDLRALRMVHLRCVDTTALFPHRMGPPYRLKLRDLVKQHLGRLIQTGGATVGHSSVEDSVATLDLVRHFILNARKVKPPVAVSAIPSHASLATPTSVSSSAPAAITLQPT